jgi:hypothetical protein
MATASKATSIGTLTRLLDEAFALHGKGASGARLGRAYGVADGYMLALMELGVASQRELGSVVAAARSRLLTAPGEAGEATAAAASAGDGSSGDSEGARAA